MVLRRSPRVRKMCKLFPGKAAIRRDAFLDAGGYDPARGANDGKLKMYREQPGDFYSTAGAKVSQKGLDAGRGMPAGSAASAPRSDPHYTTYSSRRRGNA